LPEMEAALRRPVFTLYLGRKSCPLGLPPDPLIAEAQTLEAAFAAYDAGKTRRPAFEDWLDERGEISCDAQLREFASSAAVRCETRRDVVVDRRMWQFDLRDEFILSPGKSAEVAK